MPLILAPSTPSACSHRVQPGVAVVLRACRLGAPPCHDQTVPHRTRRLVLLVPAAGLLLLGCTSAEQAAGDAASGVASRAAGAAAEQVKGQICGRLQDGQVSAEDKQVLAGLVSAARTAGVPEEITGPLEQVAQSGDQLPAEAVSKLEEQCAAP